MINEINYDRIDPLILLEEVAKLIENRKNEKNKNTLMSQKTSRIIIFALANKEGLSQNQLVRLSHMKGSTVSICVGSLEKEGYVKKIRNEFDPRIYSVFLTQKGYKLYDKLKEDENEERRTILKGLTPKEERELIYFLSQMKENLIK